MFRKASRQQSYLRAAIVGPSGSGKTFTALKLATYLADGGPIALVDTERGSSEKYALKLGDENSFDFDVCQLVDYDPKKYIKAIKEAAQAGYKVLVIDSLSHAWSGTGGALDQVDQAQARNKSVNRFTAWRDVTPLHNQLVDTILSVPMHVISTMRTKTEYVIEKDEKGRSVPRKIGMAPIQRDGMEYEYDIVAEMDLDHRFVVAKSRCQELDGKAIIKPGEEVAEILKNWLSDGEAMEEKPKFEKPKTKPTPKATPTSREEEAPFGEDIGADHVRTAADSSCLGRYESEEAHSDIADLVAKIPKVLGAMKPTISVDEITAAAHELCCDKFGVLAMHEIPGDELEQLKAYMKGDLGKALRAAGSLPPARTR